MDWFSDAPPLSPNAKTLNFTPPELSGTPQILRLSDCVIEKGDIKAVIIPHFPEGAWLGASRKDIDHGGWSTNGVFFGGPGKNLSDGSALLVSEWVSTTQAYDPKAIRAVYDRLSNTDHLDVYYEYYIDSEWWPLGQAFHVPEDYLANDTASSKWYPTIQYDTTVFVTMDDWDLDYDCIPSGPQKDRRRLPAPGPLSVVGKWEMKSILQPVQGVWGTSIVLEDIEVSISANGRVNFQVTNRLFTQMKRITGKVSPTTSMTVEMSSLGSTRMAAEEPHQSIETALGEIVPKLNTVYLKGDRLVMTSPYFSLTLKPSQTSHPTSEVGTWLVESIKEPYPIHESLDEVEVSIKDENPYQFHLQLVNGLFTSFSMLEPHPEDFTTTIEMGAIASTRMSAPEPWDALETFLAESLPSCESVTFYQGGLIISGPEVELNLSRTEPGDHVTFGVDEEEKEEEGGQVPVEIEEE